MVESRTELVPTGNAPVAAPRDGEMVSAPPPEAVPRERPEPRKEFGEGSRSLRTDTLSDWHKTNFLGFIDQGLSLPHAAVAVGRSVRTVYRWMAEDHFFKSAFHESRARAENEPLELIRRHADHNLQAAIYLHKQAARSARRRRQGKSEPAEHVLGQVDMAVRQLIDGMAEKLHCIPDEQLRLELLYKLKEYADNLEDLVEKLWEPELKQLRQD